MDLIGSLFGGGNDLPDPNFSGLEGNANTTKGAATALAAARKRNILEGGAFGRTNLLGQIGSRGGGRSLLFGGAGGDNVRNFDSAIGSQVGNNEADLNSQISGIDENLYNTENQMREGVRQENARRRASRPGLFDIASLGLTAAGGPIGGAIGKALHL